MPWRVELRHLGRVVAPGEDARVDRRVEGLDLAADQRRDAGQVGDRARPRCRPRRGARGCRRSRRSRRRGRAGRGRGRRSRRGWRPTAGLAPGLLLLRRGPRRRTPHALDSRPSIARAWHTPRQRRPAASRPGPRDPPGGPRRARIERAAAALGLPLHPVQLAHVSRPVHADVGRDARPPRRARRPLQRPDAGPPPPRRRTSTCTSGCCGPGSSCSALILVAAVFNFYLIVLLVILFTGLAVMIWVRFIRFPPLFEVYEQKLAKQRYFTRSKFAHPESTIRPKGQGGKAGASRRTPSAPANRAGAGASRARRAGEPPMPIEIQPLRRRPSPPGRPAGHDRRHRPGHPQRRPRHDQRARVRAERPDRAALQPEHDLVHRHRGRRLGRRRRRAAPGRGRRGGPLAARTCRTARGPITATCERSSSSSPGPTTTRSGGSSRDAREIRAGAGTVSRGEGYAERPGSSAAARPGRRRATLNPAGKRVGRCRSSTDTGRRGKARDRSTTAPPGERRRAAISRGGGRDRRACRGTRGPRRRRQVAVLAVRDVRDVPEVSRPRTRSRGAPRRSARRSRRGGNTDRVAPNERPDRRGDVPAEIAGVAAIRIGPAKADPAPGGLAVRSPAEAHGIEGGHRVTGPDRAGRRRRRCGSPVRDRPVLVADQP